MRLSLVNKESFGNWGNMPEEKVRNLFYLFYVETLENLLYPLSIVNIFGKYARKYGLIRP